MDDCEHALLDSAGSNGESVIGGKDEEYPTLEMAGLVYYGCCPCINLSGRLLSPSLVTRRTQVTDSCGAFTQRVPAVSNPYLATQSGAGDGHGVAHVDTCTIDFYAHPCTDAHGGRKAVTCKGDA